MSDKLQFVAAPIAKPFVIEEAAIQTLDKLKFVGP